MQRTLTLLATLLLLLMPAAATAQTSASETRSSEPNQGNDRDGEDGDGEVRGQADDSPALGALIIGLLVFAVLALIFAGYMRYSR